MSALTRESLQQIQALNETPLSQRALSLFQESGATPEPGLILGSLIFWAKDNLEQYPAEWLERVAGAAAQAEQNDPQAAYENLETTGILQAVTLDEAAEAMMRHVVDLIPVS